MVINISLSVHFCANFDIREVSFFTGRGAPENWGDQVLFLRSKGRITYFLKETKHFVKHFRFKRRGLSDATRG